MKINTSTPSLVSLHGGEDQGVRTVEWSLNCDFHEQHEFNKVEISPSPSISSETRRVSSSSSDSNASSSSLSCISSSESLSSSTSGVRTNDDADDNTESTSISGDYDPIISLEALSLETKRITLGSTKTGTRSIRGMNLPREKEQSRTDPPIKSLNLASPFEEKDGSTSIRSDSHEQEAWNSSSSETIDIVPFAQSSVDSLAIPTSISQEEEQQRQRRASKKYTIKTATNMVQKPSLTQLEAPKVPRTKRQRGGSDFTMASASGVDETTNKCSDAATSPSSRRKRRRINRNRAMAAQDFDSILSQINPTGLL